MNRLKFALLPAILLVLIAAPTYAENSPAYKNAKAAIDQLDEQSRKHFEVRENRIGKDFYDIVHLDTGLTCTASENAEVKITIFQKDFEGNPNDVGCSIVTAIRSLTFYAFQPKLKGQQAGLDTTELQFNFAKKHMENRAGKFQMTSPQPMDQELYRFSTTKLSELKTISGTFAEEIIAEDGLFDSVWIKDRNGWYFKMRHTSERAFSDGAKLDWFTLWQKLEPELAKADKETLKSGVIK